MIDFRRLFGNRRKLAVGVSLGSDTCGIYTKHFAQGFQLFNIYSSHIQCAEPPVCGHAKHIIGFRRYLAGTDFFRYLRKEVYKSLLTCGCLCCYGLRLAALHLGNGQVEHLRRLNIRNLSEIIHQFGNSYKFCEFISHSKALSIGSYLQHRFYLSEICRPVIEKLQSLFSQNAFLKVALHRIHFCNAVADRRSCCKHNISFTTCSFVDIVAFQFQVCRFFTA